LGDSADDNVVSLEEHRIRNLKEFEDDAVAYVECLWGRKTFAFNVAIRDLEKMRHGVPSQELRPPKTDWEALHIALHIRALANDVLRHFGLNDYVRPEDDLLGKPPKPTLD
jgi:hypothetical protein